LFVVVVTYYYNVIIYVDLTHNHGNLRFDQHKFALTTSSPLCLFTSVIPHWSLTFQFAFWNMSPFVKTTGSLQESPFENMCLPL